MTRRHRPTTEVTFALSHAMGGPVPWAFHSVNLLLHLALVGIFLVRGALRAVEGRPDAGISVPGATRGHYVLTRWRAVATCVRLLAWPARLRAPDEVHEEARRNLAILRCPP